MTVRTWEWDIICYSYNLTENLLKNKLQASRVSWLKGYSTPTELLSECHHNIIKFECFFVSGRSWEDFLVRS